MVRRVARWIEFDNAYKTMDRDYMESVWWAFKQLYQKGLVYEGRKVLLYCPRCETPVSNFEVAMDNSYELVKEEAVTVKFKIKNPFFAETAAGGQKSKIKIEEPTYFLSWTTTPWTLPGNVALAVGEDIEYVVVKKGEENYIVAKDLLETVIPGLTRNPQPGSRLAGRDDAGGEAGMSTIMGRDLVGFEYEPLFNVPAVQSDKAFKMYAADFVNTEEGTGIVHTAVVYGEDDYNLGVKVGLPVVPLLDEKGKFNEQAPELIRGLDFKESETVIKDNLAKRGLLFARAMHEHSYPHCWRCNNTLFYNAIPAWFINIQKFKKELLASNDKEINWFPGHLKHGRYEKSVEQAPDWNISRNRYWGNPIPVWRCEKCGKDTVVGSVRELGRERNTFYFARHSESESNIRDIASCYPEVKVCKLTPHGIEMAETMARALKKSGGIDIVYTSDIRRAAHTAEIVGKALGAEVRTDPRLREYNVGVLNGRLSSELDKAVPFATRWSSAPEGGETHAQILKRMLEFVEEANAAREGKRILVVSHGDPLWLIERHFGSARDYPKFAEPVGVDVSIADLHRPYIDAVVLKCSTCGGSARRIKEIFDSWVEAGSMPFAEYHYPFEQKEVFEQRYPAQFVTEYIAQTRAWFYVMHVIGLNLFGKAPFENVLTTGTIMAEDGSKLSKSKRNFPDPWKVIERYGVDSLRFFLMNSVVMQSENVNFSVKDLESVYRKVTLILWNVFNYYTTYAPRMAEKRDGHDGKMNVLDGWITARTQELVNGVTEYLDAYDTVRATRAIAAYIDDLSTWYLRRSRGRDDAAFFGTLRSALLTASTVIAPVMPYLAEEIYQGIMKCESGIMDEDKNAMIHDSKVVLHESIHLASWPESRELSADERTLLEDMAIVREAASVGLAARKELGIPVRQPLARLAVDWGTADPRLTEPFIVILLSELNVQKFDQLLTKEHGEHIRAFPGGNDVRELYLDTALTDELKLQGAVRSLERAVQEERKKEGMKVGEMAKLTYGTAVAHLSAATAQINKSKTYIKSIFRTEPGPWGREIEIDGGKITLKIERV